MACRGARSPSYPATSSGRRLFITLEGGEGAGKSTQAGLLADRLAACGHAVLRTREPGGAPGAEVLRAMLLARSVNWSAPAEIHLHFAARAEHLARTIQPALASGMMVVCDRFADSTMAYQGYGLGADRGLIAALTRLLPVQPSLTVLLAVSVGTGTARIAGRAQDHYESLGAEFHARVAEGYAAIAAAEPARVVVVPGDGDIQAVHERVWAAVERTLPVPA